MPQTLEETREALFRVGEQAAQLRRRLEQHDVIDGALRTILSAASQQGEDADIFAAVFGRLREIVRFDRALVIAGDAEHGLLCEAATDRCCVGLTAAAGPSAARVLRGRVSATRAGHVLGALDDDSAPLPFEPDCPALCAPFVFMGRTGFLLFLRTPDDDPFDRSDMDMGERIAVLAAQALGMKAADRAAAARTRFLASMSHELRTPLNGIIGVAALLDATTLDARQRSLVSVIRDSGQSLLRVLGGILNYAQFDSGLAKLAPHPFDLGASCADWLAEHAGAAAAKGLALDFEAPAQPTGLVLGDAGRLREVVDHLLDNAIRFAPEGRVALRLTHRTDGDRLVARLAVEDTGPGIAATEREAIFEPFGQGGRTLGQRPDGSGLGLPLCRLILREMSTTLTLRRSALGGAVFAFTLVLPRVVPAMLPASTLSGTTVAIITADEAVRTSLAEALGDAGATVAPHEAVPPLAALREAVTGRAVVMIDDALLPRAKALWLMQASGPSVLHKLPWLVICTNAGGRCGPAAGELPRVKADAPAPKLSEAVKAAARPMP